MSGGECQRLALARALLRRPRLLVLDEPTNHLAAAIVHRILDSLRALPDAPAILVVSHDPLPAAAKGKVSAGTGAVARLVVPLLEQRGYTLRLADRAGTGAEQVGLRDADVCARAVAGVDGIVHLAGAAKEASLESLVADNAVALGHLLAAASRAGVPHFVLASSMHVMGMYGRLDRFDEDAPPRPDSHYAASKLHGEALCRVYHEKSGLTVACLRLGSVTAKEADSDPGAWFSPEDVVQLIELAFALPRPSFEVFHAVADYDGGPLPPSRAARYGYACQRPGGPYAAVLDKVQRWWHSDEWARTRRGGSFAADDL